MILVSACLAGVKCKYNGGHNEIEGIKALHTAGKAILICPEMEGGLRTPRTPAEIISSEKGIKVISRDGEDVTKEFVKGAEITLEVARKNGIKRAVLKSKSPSCGLGEIYDGTFTNTLKKGNGVTAQLLIDNDIEVYTEKTFKIGDKNERDKQPV